MSTDWFLEEYKLVQGKIDNVQSSQFQVRSWSVSLVTGFVLGIFATHLPLVILAFALPVILIFHMQDRRQKRFREALSSRALELESSINILGLVVEDFPKERLARWARMRQHRNHLGSVPGLGRALTGGKAQGGWWTKNAESLFWWIQYGLIVVIALGEHLRAAAMTLLRMLKLVSAC